MSNRFFTAKGTPSSGSARQRARRARSVRIERGGLARSARSRVHVGEGVDAAVGGLDAREAGLRERDWRCTRR